MWLPRLSNPLCRILSTGAAGASPLAFFRAPTPWCRDEPPPPPPHIRFHRRDAREYRQGGDRPVRRCRGGAAFLADGSFGIASRPHHGRGGSEPRHDPLHPRQRRTARSEERRVGKEWVVRGRTWW